MTGLLLLVVVMAGSALARHTRQTSPPLVDTQPRHLHLALGSQPASLVLSWSRVRFGWMVSPTTVPANCLWTGGRSGGGSGYTGWSWAGWARGGRSGTRPGPRRAGATSSHSTLPPQEPPGRHRWQSSGTSATRTR